MPVSLSLVITQSLLKPMSIESVMPSNHLNLCHPLLLLPSIFPSIRVFSNESALLIRWPKCWSFSFSISPSNKSSGLISFMILHLFKPLECTTSRVSCNENYGLQSTEDSSFLTKVPTLLMMGETIQLWEGLCTFLSILLWTSNCSKKLNLKKKEREEKTTIKKSSLCETFQF